MRTSASLPVLNALRERIQRLEGGAARPRAVLPFGIQAIDQHLPEGGLALGALHEVAGGSNGAIDGAAAALFTAGIAARTRGQVLWCVTRQDLFAPAIAQAGLLPDRVIYVDASDEPSVLACFEEGLRHGGLGAVVAEVATLSMTASRRLQLAAEGSVAIGRARWRLELIRCRAGESADFEVEACDAKGRLALPSNLVHGSDQMEIGQRRVVG
jgi:protein ImuA